MSEAVKKRYEVQENKGNLHKSKDKPTDSHPDMFGSCKIEGKIYKISGWRNESKAGNTYLSLSFQEEIKPKDEDPDNSEASTDIDKNDLPF